MFWLPGTYHVCWQGHCVSPEIKMLSSLSLFQAKCQESNYGRARGLEAGKSQPHLGAARLGPGFQKAGGDVPERAGGVATLDAEE